jgi:hypothetical protein
MRGHMLEVDLLTLDPKSFENIQDFFTKFNDLLSQLKACGVDKSKEEKKMVLTIISNIGTELSVFVSTFHTIIFSSRATWKMPSLEDFIESLTQEQTKLINMGTIKGPRAHALTMHDGSHKYHKYKYKYKWKAHAHMKKEGYTKPFTDASRSKGEKGRKGEKCTYCHKGFHSESACMQKKIDLMSQILQQNNLGYHIPEGAKKNNPEDPNSKKGNSSHGSLIAINSSSNSWIIDSGESHHMDASEEVYYSLYACKGPPILMGDNSPVEVTDKGRIELTNGSFENVLHVPKISVNLLSMYQMTNSSTRNKFVFTPNFVDIYDMQTNSRVSTGEVNHHSRLCTFSEFIEPDFALLLTHANESSRIWHERFGNLNFRYMQQLIKHILVDGIPDIHFSKGVCKGCVLRKHPQKKFIKGKSQ